MTLSEYLRDRELQLDPVKIEAKEDVILESDELLQEATDLWGGHKNILRYAIQARLNAIGAYMLNKAIPEEVMVYRQAVVEIGALITDFDKYAAENARRKATSTEPVPATVEAEAETPPATVAGQEGTL